MNSLGYDAELNKVGNDTGRGGKLNGDNRLDIWSTTGENAPSWVEADLVTTSGSANEQFTAASKWFDTADNAASTGQTANQTLSSSTTGSLFFKHNGVIWEWSQTKGTGENAEVLTISLSTHSTTVPNVFKGTKKVSDPNSSQDSSATDTAYTFKKWEAPASGESTNKAENCGVKFEFKVAI